MEANKLFYKLFYNFEQKTLEDFKEIRPGLVNSYKKFDEDNLKLQNFHEEIDEKEHFILSYLLVALERMGQISEELYLSEKVEKID